MRHISARDRDRVQGKYVPWEQESKPAWFTKPAPGQPGLHSQLQASQGYLIQCCLKKRSNKDSFPGVLIMPLSLTLPAWGCRGNPKPSQQKGSVLCLIAIPVLTTEQTKVASPKKEKPPVRSKLGPICNWSGRRKEVVDRRKGEERKGEERGVGTGGGGKRRQKRRGKDRRGEEIKPSLNTGKRQPH